ncbi:leucine-rich repeat domain-containing protein [Simkania negevensis]|uniref:Leucine-rich repeat domain-containing protein n=1 Tax=Simkania negevensis TaxID=83561 RepID=A0ABS3AUB0_9BACT|nr:leucine-rich repeat domain-containing protein [Simkania negevensis]
MKKESCLDDDVASTTYRLALACLAVAASLAVATGAAILFSASVIYIALPSITSLFFAIASAGLRKKAAGLERSDKNPTSPQQKGQKFADVIKRYCQLHKKHHSFCSHLRTAVLIAEHTSDIPVQIIKTLNYLLVGALHTVVGNDSLLPRINVKQWNRGVSLEMSSAALTDSNLRYILCQLGEWRTTLSCLDLRGCLQVTESGLAMLRDFPSLTALNLSGCKISSEVIKQLEQLPNLRILYLQGCNKIDSSLLKKLEESTIVIRPDGTTNSLEKDNKLKEAFVDFKHRIGLLSGERSEAIREGLTVILKEHREAYGYSSIINLSHDSSLTDKSLAVYLEFSQRYSPDLTVLRLENSPLVTGEGAFQHLRFLPIESLYLAGSGVTDKGLMELVPLLKTLKYLDLRNCMQCSHATVDCFLKTHEAIVHKEGKPPVIMYPKTCPETYPGGSDPGQDVSGVQFFASTTTMDSANS